MPKLMLKPMMKLILKLMPMLPVPLRDHYYDKPLIFMFLFSDGVLARGRGCAPCPARCAQEGQPKLSTRWKPNSYEVPPQLRERPSLQRHLAGSGWCCSSPQLHAQRWILFRPLTPELGNEAARMSAGSVWRAMDQPLPQ